MMWLIVTIAVGAVLILITVVSAVLRGRSSDPVLADDVDPVFPIGVIFVGAGVATAATVGPVMYLVMTFGLILMGVGAFRSGHHGPGSAH